MDNPECSICFDDVIGDNSKELVCNHFMHKTCYDSFLKSPAQKRCPMCRKDIFKDMNICQICRLEMDIRPDVCEVVESSTCGCLFHYRCLKNVKIFFCRRCTNSVNIEYSDLLSYLYFATQHIKIIGNIPICKKEGCLNIGNPSRFGFCDEHNDNKSSNKAIILSFMYFVRYVNDEDEERKYEIFLELVKYMNKNHKFDDPEQVDFFKVNEILNKNNILHN